MPDNRTMQFAKGAPTLHVTSLAVGQPPLPLTHGHPRQEEGCAVLFSEDSFR